MHEMTSWRKDNDHIPLNRHFSRDKTFRGKKVFRHHIYIYHINTHNYIVNYALKMDVTYMSLFISRHKTHSDWHVSTTTYSDLQICLPFINVWATYRRHKQPGVCHQCSLVWFDSFAPPSSGRCCPVPCKYTKDAATSLIHRSHDLLPSNQIHKAKQTTCWTWAVGWICTRIKYKHSW